MKDFRFLTTDDLAKPTSEGGYAIKKSTQAKMRMQGIIPYSKIGYKLIRYDRIEIDKWIEQHSVISNEDILR